MFTKKLIDNINSDLNKICDPKIFEIKENLKIFKNNDYILKMLDLVSGHYIEKMKLRFAEIIKKQKNSKSLDEINIKTSIWEFYSIIKLAINYKYFIKNKNNIYKFNKEFLHDYMNYHLNTDYLKQQNINFNGDSILIYTEDKIFFNKFNLIYIFKDDKNQIGEKTRPIIYFLFKDIDSNEELISNHLIGQDSDSDYNLNSIWDKNDIKSKDYDYIYKILKLVFYIQSSNVDLRKVSPEFPKSNTRKEKDRTFQNNINNDSLFEYFNVGYNWQKLPLYNKNEWEVRGHFRMQPCGENKKSHKIIFIEPQIRKRQILDLEKSNNI